MSFRSIGSKIALLVGSVSLILGLTAAFLMDLPRHAFLSLAAYLALLVILILLASRHYIGIPLEKLTREIKTAEEGDFLARAKVTSRDEIGILTRSFNNMLAKITDLNVDKIDADRELRFAKAELKYKKEIERKSRIIEETNRELHDRIRQITLLYEIHQTVNSTLDLNTCLKLITQQVGSTLEMQEFAILLLDEEMNHLVVKTTYGFPQDAQVEEMTFRLGEGISGKVAQTGEMMLIPDTSKDRRYLHYKGKLLQDGSFLSIPMTYKDKLLGALNFSRSGVNSFTEDDIRLLSSVAHQAAMAIMNAKLYQETVELSLTDELTGLHNRRYFDNHLEMEWTRSQRFGNPLSLAMIDIDHFKHYNDTHGHLLGDEVLKKVARVIMNGVRQVDTVARFGGEEFVVILPRNSQDTAIHTAEKLRQAIEANDFPREEQQPNGKLTVSIGVASWPGDASAKEDLLEAADFALYEAKRAGRNRVESYRPTIVSPPSQRLGAQ